MSTIGIIGFGFVGQALYSVLRDPHGITIHDPPLGFDRWPSVRPDITFCCLPTPTINGKQDVAAYEQLFEQQLVGYLGIVVIKSTVLPEHLERWATKFNLIYNPEFLNQNSAKEDFKNQRCIPS